VDVFLRFSEQGNRSMQFAFAIRGQLGVFTLAVTLVFAAASARAEIRPDVPSDSVGPRQLAPGVLHAVDPQIKADEEHAHHDIPELLKVDPNWLFAKNVDFRHQSLTHLRGEDDLPLIEDEEKMLLPPVWALHFWYKPVRMIEVDVPNPDGRLEKKLVWYMVYRVVNRGDKPVRFVPRMVLGSIDTEKQYLDRLIPVALGPIQRREDRGRRFLNKVEMAREIPPSPEGRDVSVWGVATWADVDPRTDRFNIYVQGLTNALRWSDDAEGNHQVSYKTLQLNFWRPGDEFYQDESEVRVGGPEELDYTWIYR
jgi:hypothetical protein